MKHKGWVWKSLGELFDFESGKTMSASARNGTSMTPFLRTSNVFWDEIDLSKVDQMTISPKELMKKNLKPGDLLVCEGGEIGRAAVWSGELSIVSFQNHIHRLRPKAADIDPRFYVFFLQSAFTQLGLFEGVGNKTTIPNLSRNRLAALEFPHPPLDEQQSISKTLAQIRLGIKTNLSAIKVSNELKVTTLETLFTQGRRNEGQKETEIGLVPNHWTVNTLDHYISKPEYGFTASSSSIPIGPKFLRITDIQDGKVNWDSVPFCSCNKKDLIEKRLLTSDIVVARIGATTGKVFLIESCPEAIFASYLIRLRTNESMLIPRFLYYFMQSNAYWNQIRKQKGGKLKGGINIPILSSLCIAVPFQNEQQEIIAILDSIDQKIDILMKKQIVLEDLFKTVLHKLMTGEVSVGELDLLVLEKPAITEGVSV